MTRSTRRLGAGPPPAPPHYPAAGHLQAGNPGAGYPDAGYPDAAYPGAGPAAPPHPAPALVIDALGRKCPIPIIMLAQRIREVPVGQIVAVLADDPAAKSDIPAWCGIKSQEFVAAAALTTGWALLIRRCY